MPKQRTTGTNIKRRPVAFNLDDPIEWSLNEHANRHTNFSAYIKRLIQRDKEGGAAPIPEAPAVPKDKASSFL